MKRNDRSTSGGLRNENRKPPNADESGLSFEAEPGEVEGMPDDGGELGTDPAKSSPRAAFTPGPAAQPHNPFWTPALTKTMIIVAVVVAAIFAAVWLL